MSDDDLELAVADQNAIQVGFTDGGVIRIVQGNWPDDDAEVLLQPENAQRLCAAILILADVCPYTFCDFMCAARQNESKQQADEDAHGRKPHKPKDITAAERQRRRRAKLKDRDTAVTDRDTVRDTPSLLPEFENAGG